MGDELGELIGNMIRQLWNGMKKVETEVEYEGVLLKISAYKNRAIIPINKQFDRLLLFLLNSKAAISRVLCASVAIKRPIYSVFAVIAFSKPSHSYKI